jgi:hypothetical protein
VPKVICAVFAGAALAGAAAAIAAAPSSHSATAKATPDRAGARPVALTLALRTELQCGHLPGRKIAVRLPAQERVPHTIPNSAIRVGGTPAARVRVSGQSLAIDLAQPRGIAVCNVISTGIAKIVVTRAANLGNPAAPGTYSITIRHAAATFDAPLTIR